MKKLLSSSVTATVAVLAGLLTLPQAALAVSFSVSTPCAVGVDDVAVCDAAHFSFTLAPGEQATALSAFASTELSVPNGWIVDAAGAYELVLGNLTTGPVTGLNPGLRGSRYSTTAGVMSLDLAPAPPAPAIFGPVTLTATLQSDGMHLRNQGTGSFTIVNQFELTTIPAAPVPEPESWAMMFAGLLALGFMDKRRPRSFA